ncbi:hypothetical protein CYMTET_23932 [Cymbomonas tetramitiformis]|uniref:Uncharacterized protein n=1 Tax=Cymbomonas tetramitiformis TaxID=36881 RepID=A0AAE0FXE0_9CHLO|nr:hypothetical protein CYMTET_23932 [Cymbomonas tetramitiformis]
MGENEWQEERMIVCYRVFQRHTAWSIAAIAAELTKARATRLWLTTLDQRSFRRRGWWCGGLRGDCGVLALSHSHKLDRVLFEVAKSAFPSTSALDAGFTGYLTFSRHTCPDIRVLDVEDPGQDVMADKRQVPAEDTPACRGAAVHGGEEEEVDEVRVVYEDEDKDVSLASSTGSRERGGGMTGEGLVLMDWAWEGAVQEAEFVTHRDAKGTRDLANSSLGKSHEERWARLEGWLPASRSRSVLTTPGGIYMKITFEG